MTQTETDVLVVGGGPVGLAIAIGLRRFGIDCILVERHPSTLDFPKGRLMRVRTMEIFRQWGLQDKIAPVVLSGEDNLFNYRGETLFSKDFTRIRLGGTDTPFSPTHDEICSQELLEPILVDRARADGVDIRHEVRLADFVQDANFVHAELEAPRTADAIPVRARYMIAADGARGQTRARLGIGDQTLGVLGGRISILFEADLGNRIRERQSGVYLLDRPRRGTAIAAVDNRRQWLLMVPRDLEAESEDSFSYERCRELVAEALGDAGVKFKIRGRKFWTGIARVASQFAQGRILLAGDAAHQTTPIGGMGMNLGIADAHNLAWKVAGALSGWADPRILDTYEAERKPIAEQSALASLGAALPPKSIDALIIGAVYDSAAIIPDGTPAPALGDPLSDYVPTGRPGHRAPHVWIDDEHQRSTLDLWGEWFTLLVGLRAAELAEPMQQSTAVPLHIHAVGGPTLPDPEGILATTYGLTPRGAVLVRPDGYVAWRSEELIAAEAELALQAAAGAPFVRANLS